MPEGKNEFFLNDNIFFRWKQCTSKDVKSVSFDNVFFSLHSYFSCLFLFFVNVNLLFLPQFSFIPIIRFALYKKRDCEKETNN